MEPLVAARPEARPPGNDFAVSRAGTSIQFRRVGDNEYGRNARRHPEGAVAKGRSVWRSGLTVYALTGAGASSASRIRAATRGLVSSRLPKPGSAPSAIAAAWASG